MEEDQVARSKEVVIKVALSSDQAFVCMKEKRNRRRSAGTGGSLVEVWKTIERSGIVSEVLSGCDCSRDPSGARTLFLSQKNGSQREEPCACEDVVVKVKRR